MTETKSDDAGKRSTPPHCSEGDKIRFPDGSTFTIFSMLENTPLHGQLFQITDDGTGELFTESVEYLKNVELIPNTPRDRREAYGQRDGSTEIGE